MLTPFLTTAIPRHQDIRPTSQARPRRLQAIELVSLGSLFIGGKIISNHWVEILLNQFFGE